MREGLAGGEEEFRLGVAGEKVARTGRFLLLLRRDREGGPRREGGGRGDGVVFVRVLRVLGEGRRREFDLVIRRDERCAVEKLGSDRLDADLEVLADELLRLVLRREEVSLIRVEMKKWRGSAPC